MFAQLDDALPLRTCQEVRSCRRQRGLNPLLTQDAVVIGHLRGGLAIGNDGVQRQADALGEIDAKAGRERFKLLHVYSGLVVNGPMGLGGSAFSTQLGGDTEKSHAYDSGGGAKCETENWRDSCASHRGASR